MSEECRHSKISSQDFVTCEGCGFKVKDILAALQSSLDTATDEIAALRAKVSEQEWEYASVVNQFHDALKRITAMEKVAEAAISLAEDKRSDTLHNPLLDNLEEALREAGYLGGGE
mgnify:CR=1 FL=1